MPRPSTRCRPPLAGEPIRSSIDALAVVSLAIHRPLVAETVAFLLDHEGRSNTITVVSGTTQPDAVLSVAECMAIAGAGSTSLCGMVIATVRPDIALRLPGDADRWLDASHIAEVHGIELIEWFVVGPAGLESPRQLLGEPSRW